VETAKGLSCQQTQCQRDASTDLCLLGVVKMACVVWRQNKTRKFFSRSYLAPMPREHAMQQLGIGINKAYTLHLHNAMRKMDDQPGAASP